MVVLPEPTDVPGATRRAGLAVLARDRIGDGSAGISRGVGCKKNRHHRGSQQECQHGGSPPGGSPKKAHGNSPPMPRGQPGIDREVIECRDGDTAEWFSAYPGGLRAPSGGSGALGEPPISTGGAARATIESALAAPRQLQCQRNSPEGVATTSSFVRGAPTRMSDYPKAATYPPIPLFRRRPPPIRPISVRANWMQFAHSVRAGGSLLPSSILDLNTRPGDPVAAIPPGSERYRAA